ncbi:hypothetical protein BC831DRAFT_513507 [Entophlyctis helioformis]|nr:hypothetical protein BC831DRAFT_513507 [Entophlyctis helioformis]
MTAAAPAAAAASAASTLTTDAPAATPSGATASTAAVRQDPSPAANPAPASAPASASASATTPGRCHTDDPDQHADSHSSITGTGSLCDDKDDMDAATSSGHDQQQPTAAFGTAGGGQRRRRLLRHNLKLPTDFKKHFLHPYDAYLRRLLDETAGINPVALLGANEVQRLLRRAPHGVGWTIWVTTDLRDDFMARKNAMGPNVRHSQLVNVMVAIMSKIHPDVDLPNTTGSRMDVTPSTAPYHSHHYNPYLPQQQQQQQQHIAF